MHQANNLISSTLLNYFKSPALPTQKVKTMNTLRSTFATAVMACALALPALNVSASSVAQKSINDLATTSDMIFEGQVVGIRSEAVGKKVYTYISFEVNDVVRGKYAQDTVELRYLGGTANGVTMKVGDMKLPSYGERGIYFVEKLGGNTVHPLRGWGQGHFIVKQGSDGDKIYNSLGKAITEIDTGKQANISSAVKINNHTAAGVEFDTGAKQIMGLGSFKDAIRGLK